MKKIVNVVLSVLITVYAFGQKQDLQVSEVTEPQFTGITNGFNIQNEPANLLITNYLMKAITYPKKALKCNIEGTEVVQFKISTSGKVSDIKIINSVCPAIDKEIIGAVESTNGMWIPGYNEGNPTEMNKEISIVFHVANTGNESVKDDFKKMALQCFNKGNKELYVKNNPKKALKYYSMGINYLPFDQSLLLLRGLCSYELGDKEGAKTDWDRLVSVSNFDITEFSYPLEKMRGYNEMMAILGK